MPDDDWHADPRHTTDAEVTRVQTNPTCGVAFYAVMAVLSLGLFVLNVCTEGTMLGLISTGGLAVLMGYRAYRGWLVKRNMNRL